MFDLNLIISLIVGIAQIIVAFIVYQLSVKWSMEKKLEHKNYIKPKIDELIQKIYIEKIRNHKVTLIDVDVYDMYYPSNENRFGRYSHIGAEIKNTRFDGVEFFWGISKAYFDEEIREFSLKNKNNSKPIEVTNIGIIPYEWIVDINLNGDEYNATAILYCKFNKKSFWKIEHDFKPMRNRHKKLINKKYYRIGQEISPFKKIIFYTKNKDYIDGNDYFDLQYYQIEIN